ncbi:MAG: 4Fe-4S dicluster domain-containing protein [Deltaproteobacteria bacterium]|nr:4Fe-4S dicluster domain-containing protein [Deltaproteobacteria bacterium]
MVFTILLYLSLIIFLVGIVYKVATWFTRKIGIYGHDASASARLAATLKGIFKVLFSVKLLTLVRVFLLDVVLQVRILKQNFLRWFMHMLIYGGFMLLLLLHALEDHITTNLVEDYYSTLNPFLFLRDFFGVMVVVGLGIAVFRRFVLKVPRLATHAMDRYAIIILSVIMVSGLFLEGGKISSHAEFQYMVEDYAGTEDEDEIRLLESYWVQHFGTVSPHVKGPFDQETLDQGLELHESNCAACHAPNTSAFGGFALAKLMRPVALALDQADGVTFFYWAHVLSCFLGLAYLPFSKMFHLFASSASLMANAVMDPKTSDPLNIATRQVMELDACTHCGTCSRHCSVAVGFYRVGNSNILPSEKIQVLKQVAAGKPLDEEQLRAIQEGIYLCTNCGRCTLVCPAGICLKELWFSVREMLIQKDLPIPLILSPFSWHRGLNRSVLDPVAYDKPIDRAQDTLTAGFPRDQDPDTVTPLGSQKEAFDDTGDPAVTKTYAYCFSCENCTTVCPVVENYEAPESAVGLLPHQIMRAMGLGIRELAMGSKMLWYCLTCYQCQEHCPQGVKVTDILYELKNRAVQEARAPQGVSHTMTAERRS